MIFLLGNVSSFMDGEQLTQLQIDNINSTSVNLDCRYLGTNLNRTVVQFRFSCQGIEHKGQRFQVIRKEFIEIEPTISFFDSSLLPTLRQRIVSKMLNTITRHRKSIDKLKSQNLIPDLNDFSFNNAELNR